MSSEEEEEVEVEEEVKEVKEVKVKKVKKGGGEEIVVEKGDQESGLVIRFEETQEGNVNQVTEERKLKTNGTLTVENKMGGPIYDFELNLKNIDKTDLRKTIEEGYLKEFENSGKQIPYSITAKEFMSAVSEELNFGRGLVNPVAIYNTETPVTMNYTLRNNTKGPLSVNVTKDLPEKVEISELPTGKGELSKDGQLKWNIGSLEPGEEVNASIDAAFLSEDTEEFGSGKIEYKAKGGGFTLAGGKVESVKAGAIERVTETTEKEERMKERGVWDARIHVENKSSAPIRATGKIGVMSGSIRGGSKGKEAEEETEEMEEQTETIPGRVESPIPGRREYPQIVSDPVSIAPGETKIIGPFPIESEDEPRLTFDVGYEIIPQVVKKIEGTFTIDEIPIPCLNAEVTKDVKVNHPSAAAGLSDTELMSNLREPVEVKVKVENTGSAEVNFIELSETIPAGFKPPKKGGIEASLKTGEMEAIDVPEENLTIEIRPKDTSEENELNITVHDISHVFEAPVGRGDHLKINYETIALSPEPGRDYHFPSLSRLAMTSADKPTEFKLEDTPELSTVEIKREIRKKKEIAPGAEEKEFVVTAVLRNEGSLPAKDYEFKDIIPPNFDFIAESAEPQPSRSEEMPEGLEVRWTIEEIPPEGEETIEYTVKGLTGFKVSNLKKIRE